MNQQDIKQRLAVKFGEENIKAVECLNEIIVTVPKDKIVPVCEFMKNTPELEFDFLSFVAGVDLYPSTPRFEVVYQLYSIKQNHRFRLKALVEEESNGLGSIESVTPIWPTANWHERETAEMFGISFLNHPDPRKLLLPEEWTIHPLRKDFSVEGNDSDTPDLWPQKQDS
jgi:NADH-quinone oxidoreductase subunit C